MIDFDAIIVAVYEQVLKMASISGTFVTSLHPILPINSCYRILNRRLVTHLHTFCIWKEPNSNSCFIRRLKVEHCNTALRICRRFWRTFVTSLRNMLAMNFFHDILTCLNELIFLFSNSEAIGTIGPFSKLMREPANPHYEHLIRLGQWPHDWWISTIKF